MRKYILAILILLLGILMILTIRENDITKENTCKRTLYEEDYIDKGCDKYFQNEKWYKDYMKVVNKWYKKLGK